MIGRQHSAAHLTARVRNQYMEASLCEVVGELQVSRLRQTLSAAVQRSRFERRPGLDAEVRAGLVDVCRHARRVGLRAEHVVVLVKKVWSELPLAPRFDNPEQENLLACVISTCIKEYFLLDQPPANSDGQPAPRLS